MMNRELTVFRRELPMEAGPIIELVPVECYIVRPVMS